MSDLVTDLVEAASEVSGVSAAEILGRGRALAPVAARHAVWLILREHGWELTRIGAAWARDHSTISHGTQQAERRARVDPDERFLIEEIRRAARRRTLPDGIESRVQASIFAMDQEIATAETLVGELASRLATLRAVRAQAVAIMRDAAEPARLGAEFRRAIVA